MDTNEWVTGEVVLSINGEPLKMQMTVPAKPVKPHRMLPVFQKMTNSFVEMSAVAAGARGATIPCRMGCAACCRQPVPISEIEIYYLAELVESMPEPQRSGVKARFREAVDHFEAMGWFDKMKAIGTASLTESTESVTDQINKASVEYFNEGVPCPFLDVERGACTIHESRPIACREYLVTSPAANCSNLADRTVEVLDLVLKPSHIVRYIGNTGRITGFTPLIKALDLAEEYPEKFEERTGERWAADFFGKLTRQHIPKSGIEPPENAK
jgi:Fe-S-cluster containining protein